MRNNAGQGLRVTDIKAALPPDIDHADVNGCYAHVLSELYLANPRVSRTKALPNISRTKTLPTQHGGALPKQPGGTAKRHAPITTHAHPSALDIIIHKLVIALLGTVPLSHTLT